MSLTKNIYHQVNRPVGRTTLGRLIYAFALFLVPVVLFASIADQVREGETQAIDNRVLLGIYHHSTPALNEIILRATDLGSPIVIIGMTIIISGVLAWRMRWQACAQLFGGVMGAGALNFILKWLFERDRPHLWQHIVTETGYSFPSGHAMLSSALAFAIVVIVWHAKWRWPAIIVGGLYVIGIAFTRLYLGVHYPTDIVAGWCVSAAWTILVAAILGSLTIPKKLAERLKNH
jgi:membrane-associated phospholipid phosphatase